MKRKGEAGQRFLPLGALAIWFSASLSNGSGKKVSI